MISSKHLLLLAMLILLAMISFLLSLLSGSVDLSLGQLLRELFQPQNDLAAQVLREIRIPRALAAFTTGGLLALAGVIMQVLLRNPLADPYILGISGGAAVGALSAILLGLGGWWMSMPPSPAPCSRWFWCLASPTNLADGR